MTILTLALIVAAGLFCAGVVGGVNGIGGGIVVVPMLTLFMHVDLRYAIGASLVSLIATSSGAAAAYVREGFTNIRLGMFLEVATTLGAVSGAFLSAGIPTRALGVIFGVVLFVKAFLSSRSHLDHPDARASDH